MIFSVIISCENRKMSPNFISISPKIEKYKKNSEFSSIKDKNHIFFRNKTLNIGSCKPDTTIIFKYFFINDSQRKISIKKVIGSCGCIKIKFKKEDILPKEESFIEVNYTSEYDVGYYKKAIYVYFESSELVTLSFFVRVI